jgi:hypothetical protein
VSAGAAQAAFVAASATAPPKRAADNVPASTGVKIQRKNKHASASSAAALQKVSSKASSLVEKKLSLSGTLYGLDLRLREGPLQVRRKKLRHPSSCGGYTPPHCVRRTTRCLNRPRGAVRTRVGSRIRVRALWLAR